MMVLEIPRILKKLIHIGSMMIQHWVSDVILKLSPLTPDSSPTLRELQCCGNCTEDQEGWYVRSAGERWSRVSWTWTPGSWTSSVAETVTRLTSASPSAVARRTCWWWPHSPTWTSPTTASAATRTGQVVFSPGQGRIGAPMCQDMVSGQYITDILLILQPWNI